MCGEYRDNAPCDRFHTGSPPHVWGILFTSLTTAMLFGITPTCVGNTAKDAGMDVGI